MRIKTLKIIVSWLMVIATMLIIYSFSGETAQESTETSGGIIEAILKLFLPNEKVTVDLIARLQHPIRKLAHFSIFALLGFTLANAFKVTFKIKHIFNYLLSFASVIIYASSDELHQGLIDGRGPSFKDVLIDSWGGLTGILVFALMLFIFNKLITKKDRE